ncbi:MAG: Dabb family protein [Pedobacter sp.]|nr:Dabb family protein [Chitinophagaceae bacterium]
MQLNNLFIHHVYFWLKNDDSVNDLNALIEGLKKLSKVATFQQFHIGKPASTSRDVIDGSYAVSWCLLFASKEDEAVYQTHQIHLNFIKECSHLWSKVVVYDSVDA